MNTIDQLKKEAFDILIPLMGLKETNRTNLDSFIKGIVFYESKIPGLFVFYGHFEHGKDYT